MKKSIIKRRKRVVPAMQEQSPGNQHLASFPVSNSEDSQYQEHAEALGQRRSSSINPDGSINLDLRSRDAQLEHQAQYPPPVDFTDYQIDQRRPSFNPSQQQQQQGPLPSVHDQTIAHSVDPPNRPSPLSNKASRKRSHSNTERDESLAPTPESARANRLSSISSILNPTQHQRREEMPIDPNLSSIGQQALRHASLSTPHQTRQQFSPPSEPPARHHSIPESSNLRAQRKAQLRQEAEQIREMLRAKERELEELDGEG